MIKEENKRITITFSDEDLTVLDKVSNTLNISKSNLLNICFKNYLIDNNCLLNEKSLIIFDLLKRNPFINVLYMNNLFVVYTVGLEDNVLKIIDLKNIVSSFDDVQGINEELNYLLLVA